MENKSDFILQEIKLRKSEKKILHTLVANSNYNIVTLSQRQLAIKADVPVCTTKMAVKELIKKGLIRQIKRENKAPSTYILCAEKVRPPEKIMHKNNQFFRPPERSLATKVRPPVQNIPAFLDHLKEKYTAESSDMSKEDTEFAKICFLFHSMLDNNEEYPTGIVFNILSYFLDILQDLYTQGLKRSVGAERIFFEQKTNKKETQKDCHTFGQIPLKNNSLFDVTSELIEQYQKAYPFIDVTQRMKDIIAWNVSNPSRRKTAGGILRHINNWLKKENKTQFKRDNVDERGVPILTHISSSMFVEVPYDLED